MLSEKEIRIINELLTANNPKTEDELKLRNKFSLMLFKMEMMDDENINTQ